MVLEGCFAEGRCWQRLESLFSPSVRSKCGFWGSTEIWLLARALFPVSSCAILCISFSLVYLLPVSLLSLSLVSGDSWDVYTHTYTHTHAQIYMERESMGDFA